MARTCTACGAELFEGQRFCRGCGRPTDELPGEHAPTQMMPPEPNAWGAQTSAKTAPAAQGETSPVYEPSYYQAQVPPMPPAAYVPPFVAPRSRSPIGWILAFVGVAVFAVIILAVMFVARQNRRFVADGGITPSAPTRQAGESAFDDSSADKVETSGGEVTRMKVFLLPPTAKISVKNQNGNITVTGWDQPQTEVREIRRGSTSDSVSSTFFKNEQGNLSVRAAGGRGVRYEIRIPHAFGRLDVETQNGGITLSDVTGGRINAQSHSGSLDLNNISGLSSAQTQNGKVNVVLVGGSKEDISLSCDNGSIALQIKAALDADLVASTTRGGILIDDSFGIPVERNIVGAKAEGKIGDGGPRLTIRTTNGNIKVTK